ncbi:MAG TPA: MotA/TolQ/ExbB proton channel family protein [Stellaceae bacterium]|nr:MotA/TolQ/ExbB proton channel family protein [Stellaceae bacterium]
MSIRETLRTSSVAMAGAIMAVLLAAAPVTGAFAQATSTPAPGAAPAAAPSATPDQTTPPAAAPAAPAPSGDQAQQTPAAPSTPVVTPPSATTTVENPYGLQALWDKGDFVSRGTLIILSIMSVGSWYIMISKYIEQALLLSQGREADKKFWNAGSVQGGTKALGAKSAFRMMAEDGLKATEHHEGALTEQIDLHTWVTMSLQRSVEAITNRMQGGLAFLATVGSTAPFVGLFGTVWGIYHALTAIGIAGQASIDKVAGPVGEALIMTAFGLFVAVPAVMGYNWMIRRNKAAMDQVRNFSADLHALLVSGQTVRSA